MVTGSLFELAFDIQLLTQLPGSVERMVAFGEVEKLRCAENIGKFKSQHPNAKADDSACALCLLFFHPSVRVPNSDTRSPSI